MKMNRKLLTATVTIIAATTTAHLMQRDGAETVRLIPAEAATLQVVSVAPIPTAPAPTAQPAETSQAVVSPSADEPVETALVQEKPRNDIAPVIEPEMVPVAAAVLTAGTAPRDPNLADLPDMPLLPLDLINPGPLPEFGSALQDRMAAVEVPAETKVPVAKAPTRSEFGLTCGDILSAAVKTAAMVTLTLTSPCRGKEIITVQHKGMIFSGTMSHLGMYSETVPALTPEAEFVITFADGEEVSTIIDVPEAATIERVALQSSSKSGLQIHALEFGADYGEAGHVWAATPSDPETALLTNGGFLVSLGDTSIEDAHVTEIYTFPAKSSSQNGIVRVSIEAEVTAENCASDVTGQIMQKPQSGEASIVSLSLAIPDCDAVGEYLVLKNLLRDLKVVSN